MTDSLDKRNRGLQLETIGVSKVSIFHSLITGRRTELQLSLMSMEDAEEPDQTQPFLPEYKRVVVCLPKPHMFNNDYHSVYVRYGIPVFIIATFSLLIASDIGVGASAHVEMSTNGNVISTSTNLEISVFTSIGRLWEHQAVSRQRFTRVSFASEDLTAYQFPISVVDSTTSSLSSMHWQS